MTEEEYKAKYKAKLKEQERVLLAFENEHEEIFDEWLRLKSAVSNTQFDIENQTWMVGNYYRLYGDPCGDFYIHVRTTMHQCKELYGRVIRIIKPEYCGPHFSSAVIIDGGLLFAYRDAELVEIAEEEFNRAAEGLPVYYDGLQEKRYEE